MFPNFKSEVRWSINAKLGSASPSILFLIACECGNMNVIQYLLELNTYFIESVDVGNNNGLHLAAWKGKTDIMVYLIEDIGMDPTVESRDQSWNPPDMKMLTVCSSQLYPKKLKCMG